MTGRVFFEEVIREKLDIGWSRHVQLIFHRRVSRRTAGKFRTRVVTDGCGPIAEPTDVCWTHKLASHNGSIGEDALEQVVQPIEVDGQRRCCPPVRRRTRAGLAQRAGVVQSPTPGFTNQQMRALLAELLGLDPVHDPAGRMNCAASACTASSDASETVTAAR
jgi:hypothetical protein